MGSRISNSNYGGCYRDRNRDRDRNRQEFQDFDPDSDFDFDFDGTEVLIIRNADRACTRMDANGGYRLHGVAYS